MPCQSPSPLPHFLEFPFGSNFLRVSRICLKKIWKLYRKPEKIYNLFPFFLKKEKDLRVNIVNAKWKGEMEKELYWGGSLTICLYTDNVRMFAEALWCIYVCPVIGHEYWVQPGKTAGRSSQSTLLCAKSHVHDEEIISKWLGKASMQVPLKVPEQIGWLPFHLNKLMFGIPGLSMD